jgi:uncharacterized membrane protein
MKESLQDMSKPEMGFHAQVIGRLVLGREQADTKSVALFLALIVAANLLGALNLPLAFGLKLHTFQLAVFAASLFFGPVGGAWAGGLGSLFSAYQMGNPYIVIGNLLLGFAAGYFMKKGRGVFLSALLAAVIQAAWVWISDVYFFGMPERKAAMILLALLFSNALWAAAAAFIFLRFRPGSHA